MLSVCALQCRNVDFICAFTHTPMWNKTYGLIQKLDQNNSSCVLIHTDLITCGPPGPHLQTCRMPLNAGVTGYGSVASTGLSASVTGSDSAPLLILPPEPPPQWRPLTKEELEVAAGGAGWRRARHSLVLLLVLAWLAMLATAVAIVVMSPRPVETPLKWWQRTLFYRLERDVLTEEQADASGGVDGDYIPVLFGQYNCDLPVMCFLVGH